MGRILIFIFFALASTVAWGEIMGNGVEVGLRSDRGGELPIYPHSLTGERRKAYAEAVKGDCYSIVVRNRLNRRIDIVIAVDGRNIISGKKSWLRNNERMYILGPYETGIYGGWRTGSNKVNRFYFTEAGDSYAAAFKDDSAMGVIAAAVYPEVMRHEPPQEIWRAPQEKFSGSRAERAAPSAKAMDRAGTGYGSEVYSPVQVVEFEPERKAQEIVLIKYEWRETLCKLGVIACEKRCKPGNRLWDEEGFVPPPPGRD